MHYGDRSGTKFKLVKFDNLDIFVNNYISFDLLVIDVNHYDVFV